MGQEHYRTSCSPSDSERSSFEIAMVSPPAEDYQNENGLRRVESRECQEGDCGAVLKEFTKW